MKDIDKVIELIRHAKEQYFKATHEEAHTALINSKYKQTINEYLMKQNRYPIMKDTLVGVVLRYNDKIDPTWVIINK